MVSKRKLEEKARIEANMILIQKYYDEWYNLYEKSLKRLISVNKSNMKMLR